MMGDDYVALPAAANGDEVDPGAVVGGEPIDQ